MGRLLIALLLTGCTISESSNGVNGTGSSSTRETSKAQADPLDPTRRLLMGGQEGEPLLGGQEGEPVTSDPMTPSAPTPPSNEAEGMDPDIDAGFENNTDTGDTGQP